VTQLPDVRLKLFYEVLVEETGIKKISSLEFSCLPILPQLSFALTSTLGSLRRKDTTSKYPPDVALLSTIEEKGSKEIQH
jgi:hypothetical protein